MMVGSDKYCHKTGTEVKLDKGTFSELETQDSLSLVTLECSLLQ
jgi:hypothetical protein